MGSEVLAVTQDERNYITLTLLNPGAGISLWSGRDPIS